MNNRTMQTWRGVNAVQGQRVPPQVAPASEQDRGRPARRALPCILDCVCGSSLTLLVLSRKRAALNGKYHWPLHSVFRE